MFDVHTPTARLHAAPGAAPALDVRDYGTRAVAARLVTQGGLDLAITEATRLKVALPDALIATGQVSERLAYELLAEIAGLPLVELQQAQPAAFACRLVPERIARRHLIVPVQEDNKTLTYATSRPFDPEADRDVAFASGRRAAAVLAMPSQLVAALDRCYPRAGELDNLLSRLDVELRSRTGSALEHAADPDSAAVALCRRIVSGAVDAGASDIHIEPFADRADVRYRVSGILEPVLAISKDAVALVVNRFKVMARTNIALHHRPQDGAFRVSEAAGTIDVRLSTLPTVHGEKVVMRLVDGHSPLKSLESLGYDPVTLARLRRALARPDGLILFTGPTATGKTTALYAALHALLTGRTNIVSVEDPVERYVEGVNQSAVNVKAGNTFAAVLRSVLRQDPNVIMVGEIRDAEVAQIVGQAAFTGHLVLSSLHTTDAAAAVARLQHLGLEPFKIAGSLAAVFAQRLVRRLCPDCKVLLLPAAAREEGAAHGIASVPARAGAGCPRCRHTGYTDRVPVAEVLTPDDALREAIGSGAGERELRAAMRAGGHRTMREVALSLVESGVTSIEEINRVLADESDTPESSRVPDRQRVLVVDDDRTIRLMVRRLLEKDGFEVIEGENGREAIELATRERPNLLLIDLMMPEMDGYQAIGALRNDARFRALPVVVLTAEGEAGVEERVLELGADDYVLKPFDAGVLVSRVRAVFRRLARLSR
ncbi:MAG: ATPase, T2SS/T4P/T4SS family [Vicinamibacterales bacterium]